MLIGLIKMRKIKKLTQQQVANQLNISREALSYYETGKREPSLSLLLQMSEFFNVSTDFLITGKDFQERGRKT